MLALTQESLMNRLAPAALNLASSARVRPACPPTIESPQWRTTLPANERGSPEPASEVLEEAESEAPPSEGASAADPPGAVVVTVAAGALTLALALAGKRGSGGGSPTRAGFEQELARHKTTIANGRCVRTSAFLPQARRFVEVPGASRL